MATESKYQHEINKFVEAIRKVAKEIEPNLQIKDQQITGIIIIQFPADHHQTSEILTTVLGKVCFRHSMEFMAEKYADENKGDNPLAT